MARGLTICLLLLVAACIPVTPVAPPQSSLTPSPARTLSPTGPASTDSVPASPSPTGPQVSRLGVEPEELTGASIRLMHPLTGEAAAQLERLVQEFSSTNEWKIKVNVEAVDGPDEMEKRMAAALSDGDPPDLAAGYLHQILRWEAGRPLATLETYIDDPVWGYISGEPLDFYPAIWEADVVDGRRVAVPFARSAQVLFYNQSWARELGFAAAPTTPQQFADQVCAAAEANSKGGLLVTPHYAAALGWIYSFDGEILRSPRPEQSPYHFNNSETLDAFSFLRDLYDDRCAWAVEKLNTEGEFAARQALIVPGSLADIPFIAQAIRAAGTGDEWRVIGFASPGAVPAVSTYGLSLAIPITSPQRQLAAWVATKWLLEPANHVRLAEASSTFPLRASELALVQGTSPPSPQWTGALELLPGARAEPAYASWETVRWAVSDAFTQLFRSYFTLEQLPVMLNYLDLTAAELHLGPDPSIFDTPVPSPTP